MPFMTPIKSPQKINNNSEARPFSSEGRILGRGDPLETPIEVKNILKSINDADRLLSGKKEKDNTATQGRTLVPEIRPPIFDYATDYDRTSDLDVMEQVRMKQLKKQIDNEDITETLTDAEQRRMQGLRKEVADDVSADSAKEKAAIDLYNRNLQKKAFATYRFLEDMVDGEYESRTKPAVNYDFY